MTSPYMDTDELADLLLLRKTTRPRRNALAFIRKHKLPTVRNGKVLVLKSLVLDALTKTGKPKGDRS